MSFSNSAFGSVPANLAPSPAFGSRTPTIGPSYPPSPFFGQESCDRTRVGSGPAAYAQTPETDEPSSGRFDSISAMPAYRYKSHEELRFDDYNSLYKNKDGHPSAFGSSSNHFGTTSTPFTGVQSSVASGASSSMFGGPSSFSSAASTSLHSGTALFGPHMGTPQTTTAPKQPFQYFKPSMEQQSSFSFPPASQQSSFSFAPASQHSSFSFPQASQQSSFPFQPTNQQQSFPFQPASQQSPFPFRPASQQPGIYTGVQKSRIVGFSPSGAALTIPLISAEAKNSEEKLADRAIEISVGSHISSLKIKFLAKHNWPFSSSNPVSFGGFGTQAPSTSISFNIIPGKNQDLNLQCTELVKSHTEKHSTFGNWMPSYQNGTGRYGLSQQLNNHPRFPCGPNSPYSPGVYGGYNPNYFSSAEPCGPNVISSRSSPSETSLLAGLVKTTTSEDNATLDISILRSIGLLRITFEPRSESEVDTSKVHPAHGKAQPPAAISVTIFPGENRELTISSTERPAVCLSGKQSVTNESTSTQNHPSGEIPIVKDDASKELPCQLKKPTLRAPDFEECVDIETLLPKLQLDDYYTVPSIDQLAEDVLGEPDYCTRLEDFVIGRRGYGSIKFSGKTNVQQLDLNSIVKFHEREVVVYDDQCELPAIGEGLNKAAEVTLLNVKCVDKRTGLRYTEGPMVEKYKETLKKWAEEHGVQFVSYDAVEGEWKFKVEHFGST